MVGLGDWRTVGAAELSRAPSRYSFSWLSPEAEADLCGSLRRFGLLRPILCSEGAEGLTVVSGHRRLEILGESGQDRVPVHVLPPSSTSELWDLLLEDHLESRALNPVEVGLYVRLRQRDTGEDAEKVARRVLPRLGMPPKPASLEDPLWVADLPDRHRDAFAEERLPLQGVRILARADRQDSLAVLDLLEGARVGVNKFSEIARWVLECAWAEGKNAEAWLAQAGLKPLRRDVEGLRRELRRRRYPQLTQWEESFEGDVRRAGLPRNTRIAHSKAFEGGRLSCAIAFASLEELEGSLAELLELVRAGRLAPLDRYLG